MPCLNLLLNYDNLLLDYINLLLDYNNGQWAASNNMRLNPKKCKELVISFARSNVPTPTLTIDGVDLEKVQSHKVLGITLQNNLKWNDNVQEMISYGSKRLYILRTMKRAGVPVTHLLNLNSAPIQSILEYCCPVWGTLLPAYLSDKLELLQKRVFRIVFPDLSYNKALEESGYPCLDERHLDICMKTFKKICLPGSRPHSLIPPTRASTHGRTLRNSHKLSLFKCKT